MREEITHVTPEKAQRVAFKFLVLRRKLNAGGDHTFCARKGTKSGSQFCTGKDKP